MQTVEVLISFMTFRNRRLRRFARRSDGERRDSISAGFALHSLNPTY
jgi:hypothetical protein